MRNTILLDSSYDNKHDPFFLLNMVEAKLQKVSIDKKIKKKEKKYKKE